MQLDFRFYAKFRNESIRTKTLSDVSVNVSENKSYTLEEIADVFRSSSYMRHLNTPIGRAFDTVTAPEGESFCFIHDVHPTMETAVQLFAVLARACIENAERDVVYICDMTDLNSDAFGEKIMYYFGTGGIVPFEQYEVDGWRGLKHHEIEISDIAKMLKGVELTASQKKKWKEIAPEPHPTGLMDTAKWWKKGGKNKTAHSWDEDDEYEDDEYEDDEYEDDEYDDDNDPYEDIPKKQFIKPTYHGTKKLQIGTISVRVPDHMNYITKNELRGENDSTKELREQYEMVIASDDFPNSLVRHKDVPIGINFGDIQQNDELKQVWAAGNGKAKEVLTNSLKQLTYSYTEKDLPVSVVKEDKEFIILFSKSRESFDPKNYWVSYYAMIVHGVFMYGCNFFFNSKRSTKKNYEETVKEFLEKITPLSAKKSKEYQETKSKERLGTFAGENGKINPFLVAQLYSEDVIFNNDNEIVVKGDRKTMTGLQINAKSPYAASLAKLINGLSPEIVQLSVFLEDNKRLRIPPKAVAPEILKATKNMPISGLSVFELMAWHMIKLKNLGDDKYMALVDRDLITGVPGFYGYLGEIIKSFRKYNDVTGDFDVLAVSCVNLDSPISGGIESPVKGADEYHSMYVFAVKEKIDSTKDGVAKSTLSLGDFGMDIAGSEGSDDEDNTALWESKSDGDLTLIELQISAIEESWEREIEESNQEIIGEKPFTRKNDARIKKVIANTENRMNESAKVFENCMEKLDETASGLADSDAKLPVVIQLIGRCFEDLHMKYMVHTMEGMDKEVKYSIDKKFSNLSSKWKRKYNKLPSVILPKLNEELTEKKKELTGIKRKITSLRKKIDAEVQWLEENKADYDSSLSEKENVKSQLKKQKDEYTEELKKLKEEKGNLKNQKSESQQHLKEKQDKLKGLNKLLESELQQMDTEIERANSRIKAQSDEKYRLTMEEQQQRGIAEKAFFFKKKKTAIADGLLQNIQMIDSEIKKLEADVEFLQDQRKKKEENGRTEIEQQEQLVEEAEKEAQKVEEEIETNKQSLDKLNSSLGRSDSKLKEITDEVKRLRTELKDHQDRKKEYEKDMDVLATQQKQSEEEVQEIETKISEISEKGIQTKGKKGVIKQKDKKEDRKDTEQQSDVTEEDNNDTDEVDEEEPKTDSMEGSTFRSNMFANIENQFANCDFEEIKAKTLQGAVELHEVLSGEFDGTTFAHALITAAKLGVASENGVLNDKEKALVDAVLPMNNEDMEGYYEMVSGEITDDEYKLIQLFIDYGDEVAFPLLYVILGFAYVDNKVNDRVMSKLDGMFGMSLLSLFMQSGLEEVPAPAIRLDGFEAEIVEWFKSNDTLIPLKDIIAEFPGHTEEEIKKTLDGLVEKGILCGGENVFGCMYGLVDGEIQDNEDSRSKQEISGDSGNVSDLNEEILLGLKCDAQKIYSYLSIIAKSLKNKRFIILSETNTNIDEDDYNADDPLGEFTDYLRSIDGINSNNMSYRYAGFRNSFELSFWTEYVKPVDITSWIFPLDYYLEVRLLEEDGSINPNSVAERLVGKINELDEFKILEQLKNDVKKAVDDGKEVESIISYPYIQMHLAEEGNVFEVQGTQYEGRNDRIEKLKIGDKLSLHREPDNEHDKNAIELRNKNGSIGHLPWQAANLLAPAIDAQSIEAEAEVIEVTPLSQRSKKAKKALLNVKIVVNKTE